MVVTVGEKDFTLSKELLRYNSTYFGLVLKSESKEGEEQKLINVTLPDCSPETFELAVQWMYQGQINVPTRQPNANCIANCNVTGDANDVGINTPTDSRQSSVVSEDVEMKWVDEEKLDLEFYPGLATNGKAQTVSRLLAFFKLAEKIGLLGPFDAPIATIRNTLIRSSTSSRASGMMCRTALLPGHIRLAAELPTGHQLRQLIADACFREFVQDMYSTTHPPSKPFRFDKELKELDGFSSDMLRSFRQSSRKRLQNAKKDGYLWEMLDPLTDSNFKIPA